MENPKQAAPLTREEKREAKFRSKAEKYLAQLEPTEEVLLLGRFSALRLFCFCMAIMIGLFLVNWLVPEKSTFITMACNIGVVIAVFEACRAVAAARNAVLVVTDRRILGEADMRAFDIPLGRIRNLAPGFVLFVDTGEPQTSIRLKYLVNTRDFYNTLAPLIREQK